MQQQLQARTHSPALSVATSRSASHLPNYLRAATTLGISEQLRSNLELNPRAVQLPHSPQMPAPSIETGLSDKDEERNLSRDIVHDSDSSDEDEDEILYLAGVSPQSIIYKPRAKWAWAQNLPIENAHPILELGSGSECSATINRGTLGGAPLTYISRSWPLASRVGWRGFYSELALYGSKKYLRHLQGDVIPYIIGVHIDPMSVSLAMELPHKSFWREAGPAMPHPLKVRIVEAFEKIHACGVLHGDVELRHMLVGGDGKVTIIDFQASRVLFPQEELQLQGATEAEFAMEMRKVKFKLNFEGACDKEFEKMRRAIGRRRRNRERRKKIALKAKRQYTGAIPDEEYPTEEDIREPPVEEEDWQRTWLIPDDPDDKIFVVPGQTDEEVTQAMQELTDISDRLENASLPDRLHDTHTEASGLPLILVGQPVSLYNLRKRKLPFTSDGESVTLPSSKRARPSSPPPLLYDVTPPRLKEYPRGPTISYLYTSPETDDLPEAASSSSTPRPIKSRDFACETYRGSRGSYVPHPPTECRTSVERRAYITAENAAECHGLDLPYKNRGIRVPSHYKCPSRSISKGALKRARMTIEEVCEERASKRARSSKMVYGEDLGTNINHEAEFVLSHEVLDLSRKELRLLTAPEYETLAPGGSPAMYGTGVPAPPRPIKPLPRKGILRKTPAVQTVSYNKDDWKDEADLQLSPKIGPIPLPTLRAERMPLLGAFVCDTVFSEPDEKSSPAIVLPSLPSVAPLAGPSSLATGTHERCANDVAASGHRPPRPCSPSVSEQALRHLANATLGLGMHRHPRASSGTSSGSRVTTSSTSGRSTRPQRHHHSSPCSNVAPRRRRQKRPKMAVEMTHSGSESDVTDEEEEEEAVEALLQIDDPPSKPQRGGLLSRMFDWLV